MTELRHDDVREVVLHGQVCTGRTAAVLDEHVAEVGASTFPDREPFPDPGRRVWVSSREGDDGRRGGPDGAGEERAAVFDRHSRTGREAHDRYLTN